MGSLHLCTSKSSCTRLTLHVNNPSDDLSTNEDCFTTPGEVEQIIREGYWKKSAGTDEISNCILKRLPVLAFTFLGIILNNCINIGYFPSQCKKAKIVPIYNTGSDKSVKHFRPISLLCCASTLLESAMDIKMFAFCKALNIIPSFQFGFIPGYSTIHPLVKLHSNVVHGLNRRQTMVACMVDIRRAFDSVWMHDLLCKPMHVNFPTYLCRFL